MTYNGRNRIDSSADELQPEKHSLSVSRFCCARLHITYSFTSTADLLSPRQNKKRFKSAAETCLRWPSFRNVDFFLSQIDTASNQQSSPPSFVLVLALLLMLPVPRTLAVTRRARRIVPASPSRRRTRSVVPSSARHHGHDCCRFLGTWFVELCITSAFGYVVVVDDDSRQSMTMEGGRWGAVGLWRRRRIGVSA